MDFAEILCEDVKSMLSKVLLLVVYSRYLPSSKVIEKFARGGYWPLQTMGLGVVVHLHVLSEH